jgi:alpha-ketoglutarate-dependent taurine dioxygenase
MKVTKIPGLGRFGVFIDDVDLKTISHEEWMEIGKIHLESLVTIIRGNDLDHATYYNLMSKWGAPRYNRPLQFYMKYGKPLKELVLTDGLDEEDKITFANGRRWQVDKKMPGMIRVTPIKDSIGRSIGLFGDGELFWHSNECADVAFTPGVSLMGWQNMVGSCTGFCTSADWYERQSESFRKELDDMIVIHNYQRDRLQKDPIPDQEKFYKNNSCPDDDMDVPLIIRSPGGIKGVHLGVNTFDYIDGMSKIESDKLFTRIRKEMFTEEYIYKHWYQSDKDICLFDNSITLHNREIEQGLIPDRMGYRIQFDYDTLTGSTYQPFYQQEYNDRRNEKIRLLSVAMEGMEVKT